MPSQPSPTWFTRGFLLFLLSRLCTSMAYTLLRSGIAWHVFELSGSAYALGAIGIIEFVPALGLSLVGGAFADAHDRRLVIIGSQIASVAGGLLLCVATLGGWVTLPMLYGVTALVASGRAFEAPARPAFLPLLVPREVFPRAVAIFSSVALFGFMSGPIVLGAVTKWAGIGVAYGVNVVLVCLSIAALAFVRPLNRQAERRAVSWHAVLEGVRYVWSNKAVLGCMTLDLFAVLFATTPVLLPIFAKDILDVGELGYGFLASSLEIGAFAASVGLIFLPRVRRPGRILLGAVAVYGLATIVFGVSKIFLVSFVAHALIGVADGVSVVMRNTIVQLSTPDALRGRVNAVNLVFINASNQLGTARAGFLAGATSAPLTVVFGGLVSLAVVMVVAATVPSLRGHRAE